MSETIERVARAIYQVVGPSSLSWDDVCKCDERYAGLVRAEARAAIAAMREPPENVVCAIERAADERFRAAPDMQRWYGDDVWNAGIDEALREPATRTTDRKSEG